MDDGDGLENRCTCKRTVGSNPTPSAIAGIGLFIEIRQIICVMFRDVAENIVGDRAGLQFNCLERRMRLLC